VGFGLGKKKYKAGIFLLFVSSAFLYFNYYSILFCC